MGAPIVVVASGGLPVTLTANNTGAPMTIATNGRGIPVTVVASGGLPVTGFVTGPDVTAPIIISTNTISQPEGEALVHYLQANETVTWAKVGGADTAKFTITSGSVLGLPAKDYEAPDDADANRTYIVQVQATDLASNVSAIQTITVTITNVVMEPGPGPVIDLITASDSGVSSTDNLTNVATPFFNVDLTGTGAAAGDTLLVYDNGVQVASHVLTAPEIAGTNIDLALSPLTEGSHPITAKVNTAATGISQVSNTVTAIIDTTAPTLSSPTGVKTGETTASLSVTTNEANGTLYGVHSTAAPTAAQVKAGQDSTGAASSYAFNQAVTVTGAQAKSATGLTPSTAYTLRYVQEDTAGNLSSVASAAAFTTDAPSYLGPGNVITGATHFYGTYAYTAATAAALGPCIDITDQADANPLTVNFLSTGFVNVAAITAWVATYSVTTIKVARIYDQIGTAHLTSAGAGQRPQLLLSALGTAPAFYNAGSRDSLVSIASVPAPYTLITVAKRLTVGTQSLICGVPSANGCILFGTTSGSIGVYGGGGSGPMIATGRTENAWHSIQAFFQEPSNSGAVDGTSGSTAGAGDAAVGTLSIFSGAYPGDIMTVGFGFYPSNISSSFAAISANDHAKLGF